MRTIERPASCTSKSNSSLAFRISFTVPFTLAPLRNSTSSSPHALPAAASTRPIIHNTRIMIAPVAEAAGLQILLATRTIYLLSPGGPSYAPTNFGLKEPSLIVGRSGRPKWL